MAAITYPIKANVNEVLIKHLTHIPKTVKVIPPNIPTRRPYVSSTQLDGKLKGMKNSINMKPKEPITTVLTP